MKLSRRQFGAGALGLLGCSADSEDLTGEILVSAQGDDPARFALTSMATGEERVRHLATAFRGHGTAVHPRRPDAVVFCARRPGTTLLMADVATGSELARVEAEPGTHFFGHGCFSRDGHRLYTTEADIAAGVGRIGIRDGDSLKLIPIAGPGIDIQGQGVIGRSCGRTIRAERTDITITGNQLNLTAPDQVAGVLRQNTAVSCQGYIA